MATVEETHKIEVIGGFDLNEIAAGGTVIEVKPPSSPEDDVKELFDYEKEAFKYYSMDSVNSNDDYGSDEPFKILAEKMHNVVVTGKVKKRVMRVGYGGFPDQSASVKIHYNAYTEHAVQPFDSTYIRNEPYVFVIGEPGTLQGLELAVVSMQLNEKAQFLVHPDLAFRGSGLNRVPPNSEILFEVELLEIRENVASAEPEEDTRGLKHTQKVAAACRARGNEKFRLAEYQGAIKEYKAAVETLELTFLNDYEEQLKTEQLLVALYTNLLVCYVNADNPKKGCLAAQKIHEMAKNGTFEVGSKVFFNQARCLRMLGEYQGARAKLRKAEALEPNNKRILEEVRLLNKEQEQDRLRQASYGRALLF